MKKHYMKAVLIVLCLFILSVLPVFAGSEKQLVVNVLSQPRGEWEFMETLIPEFEEKTNIDVVIHYFAELERRSKSRMDASSGAGQYQVYYIDEANIAEFAANDWLIPILEYYPSDGEFDDLSSGLVKGLSYEGTFYGAPISHEGTIMFYRKDLFEEEGMAVPKTEEEYLKMARYFHRPHDLYGTATRGLRGSGMNIWRFSEYLHRFCGRYLDENGNPVFNSPEAVRAVEHYLELIKLSPSPTMSWADTMDTFQAGKVAMVSFSSVKMDYIRDPDKSKIIGKMGFAPPVAGPCGAVCNTSVHGLGISKPGCKTDEMREAAGKFIGWFSSKESEISKTKNGFGLTNARMSTFESKEFADLYPEGFVNAQKEMMKMQKMTILQIPEWPEIGDYLGIKLEELGTKAFAGEDYDIQEALDDAVNYAKGVLGK